MDLVGLYGLIFIMTGWGDSLSATCVRQWAGDWGLGLAGRDERYEQVHGA